MTNFDRSEFFSQKYFMLQLFTLRANWKLVKTQSSPITLQGKSMLAKRTDSIEIFRKRSPRAFLRGKQKINIDVKKP